MLNKFSFASLASLLVLSSACIINADDEGGSGESTSSDSNTNGTSSTTSSTTSTSTSTTTSADESSGGTSAGTGSETSANDSTGAAPACGWGRTGDPQVPEGYICGGDGEDPGGTFPIDCPEAVELMEGGPCANGDSMIEGPGCCDANGDLWYCQTDDVSEPILVTEDC